MSDWSTFYRYFYSHNFVRMASAFYFVYFIWIVYQHTLSVLYSGLVPVFSFVGLLIAMLPEGYLIDRYNRQKVILVCNTFLAISYVSLAFSTSLYLVYLIDLLSQFFTAISVDAYRALTKDMLEKGDIERGVSLSSVGRDFSYLSGDLLGGIAATFMQQLFFVVPTILSLVSILTIIRAKEIIGPQIKKPKGIRYREALPALKFVYPAMLFGVLMGGTSTAIDVYGAFIIGGFMKSGSLEYTLFIMAAPIGGIIAGYTLFRSSDVAKRPVLLLFSSLVYAGMLMLLSLTSTPYEASTVAIILGITGAISTIVIMSYITKNTPGEYLGRIFALYFLLTGSSAPLLAFLYSIVGTTINPMHVLLFTGILTLPLIALFYPIFVSTVKRVQSSSDWNT